MSVKDTRYSRQCVICGDTLVGTDDGLMVYESLKEQVDAIDAGFSDGDEAFDDPSCTLCGEDCPVSRARIILAAGEPSLNRTRCR
jgi:hypothetical protein